jgi:ABC-type glutathione transport system ATPase component
MRQSSSEAVADLTSYMAERTRNFTGREWVFKAIKNWLADIDGSRYFLLTGEPGSGKTAIAARLSSYTQLITQNSG